MATKHYRPEEIIAKLREAEVRGTFIPIHAAFR